MKIQQSQESQAVAKSTSTPARRAAADDVDIEQATELDAAVSTAREASATGRAARLQQLADAVRRGAYHPDPQRIADEILDDALLTAKLRAMLSGGKVE